MNRNNYRLTPNNAVLNERADALMNIITFLSNERVYKKSFPQFSTIRYDGIDETELIEAIEDLEKVYSKAERLHHKAHLCILNEREGRFKIYGNDTEYGTDQNNCPPLCGGATALEALKNAWRNWSIPPILILNADYYVPGVDIHTVYSVPWDVVE